MSDFTDNMRAVIDQIDGLTAALALAEVKIDKLEATKYAPPALECNADGIMTDKSQDADWLRARYFEGSARIDSLQAENRRLIKRCLLTRAAFMGGHRAGYSVASAGLPSGGRHVDADYELWQKEQEGF